MDAFDGDTSANYTVVNDGTPDGTVTFGFDYVGAGIPLAPNSDAGSGFGLRMTANDTAGASDAFTAFHNTSVAGSYTMLVDMYMAVTGTGGTTEYSHIGVGGDGATFNSVFTPISGSGAFLAMDRGRWFDVIGTIVTSFRKRRRFPQMIRATWPEVVRTRQRCTSRSSRTATALRPISGSRCQIDVVAGGALNTITYSLNGTPIVIDDTAFTDGFVSLGYADVFSSVANPFQSQFVVYDNLRVIPEPGSIMLLALGGLALLRRR